MIIGIAILICCGLVVAVQAVERMAARHIDLSKVSDDQKQMFDWFRTRVRPSLSNVRPEGRKLVLIKYWLIAAFAVVLLGCVAAAVVYERQPSSAQQRWGL